MKTKEFADTFGISLVNVNAQVKKMFPDIVQTGRPTELDENQAAALLTHFRNSSQITAEGGNHQKSMGGSLNASIQLQNLQSADSVELFMRDSAALIARAHSMVSTLQAEKERLQIELGQAKEWFSVKRVLIETGVEYPWRPLKKYSDENGYEVRSAFDANYKKVNTYHIDVWHAVYGVEL